MSNDKEDTERLGLDTEGNVLIETCSTCRYLRWDECGSTICCRRAPISNSFPLVSECSWCGEYEFEGDLDEQ